MRVVLDTNVLLSAMFTSGVCQSLLDACIDRADCTTVLSGYILEEFEHHAAGKFGVPADKLRVAAAFLKGIAEIIDPAGLNREESPDPDDLAVLGTAVAAGADALVTGDAALLSLASIRGVPIVSPRQFLSRIL